MIVHTNLQLDPNWKTHVQTDGSNIGGVPPKTYGMIVSPPGFPSGRLFYTSGSSVVGGYADWEAYDSFPVLPNTGNLQLSFDLTPDENTAQSAQAIETDTILCIGGYKFNFSLQMNYATGKIQIARESGGWVDVVPFTGPLTPNAPNRYVLDYAFDTGKKTGSVSGIQIAGVTYAVPSALQNVPAQKTTWSEGAMLQIQQDLNAKAGAFSMVLDNAQYAWW